MTDGAPSLEPSGVVVLDEREWEDAKGYFLFSPTQITTHIECERKWAWKRIAKIHTPQNKSAFLGSQTHSVLERYLREGRRPDFVSDGEAAHIASSVLHLLPAPRSEGLTLEREFRFQSPRTGFVYHGFKDLEIAPGVAVPSLELAGDAPAVCDYKTTSSIDLYAKTNDDLLFDAQSTLYGYDSMARWQMPRVDLRWVYSQTKGARRSHVTAVRLESAHAAKVFDAIEREAVQMADALTTGKQPLDLAPNTAMCSQYGGCPYQHLCTDLSSSQKARARMSNGSIIANLRARVQGAQQTAAPSPAPAPVPVPPPSPAPEKPSVMGCADTDVPAPTEIPATFLTSTTPKLEEPVAINPPESKLVAPTLPAEEPKPPEEPKAKRTRKKKEETAPAPVDVAASNGAPKAEASGTTSAPSDPKKELEDTIVATTQRTSGFTLYVDCMPIGKPARTLALFIEKAQEKIAEVHGVADYRLISYGQGAPALVQHVVEQIDGSIDLMLDTRTPEGAVLLEPLMARAAFVVRGLR